MNFSASRFARKCSFDFLTIFFPEALKITIFKNLTLSPLYFENGPYSRAEIFYRHVPIQALPKV